MTRTETVDTVLVNAADEALSQAQSQAEQAAKWIDAASPEAAHLCSVMTWIRIARSELHRAREFQKVVEEMTARSKQEEAAQ